MGKSDALLVRVLAFADAVFMPLRDWSGRGSANRLLGQREYADRGIPFRLNANDDAARKAGEQDLVALANAGLLVVSRAGRVKFPGCRLTARGEDRARALAGLPGRDGIPAFLRRVADLSKPYSLGHAPEVDFFGGRGWGPGATREDRLNLGELEQIAAPALLAGLVVASSTREGHACYALTDAGRRELTAPGEFLPDDPLPEFEPAAESLYRSAQDARLDELHGRRCSEMREIGHLPLPLGGFLKPRI